MIGGFLIFLIKSAAVLLILFLALGWFQNLHPAFDSFSHFRQIACVALLFTTLLLLLAASWVWAGVSVLTLVVSVALAYPYLSGLGPPTKAVVTPQRSLAVMQFNLRFNNGEIDKIAKAILSEEADVVLMQELTPLNFGLLAKLQDRFPYQLECNSKSNGSVALVSRHPFAKPGKQDCLRKLGFVHARLDVDGREITVAGFHSKWPWPDRQFFQIGALDETIGRLESPLILAGDFNAAPWSAVVKRVAGLARTQIVKGTILSWKPMWKGRRDVLPPVLPLDQIMASDELIPVSRKRVQDGGSDHLPVLTEFVWKGDL